MPFFRTSLWMYSLEGSDFSLSSSGEMQEEVWMQKKFSLAHIQSAKDRDSEKNAKLC